MGRVLYMFVTAPMITKWRQKYLHEENSNDSGGVKHLAGEDPRRAPKGLAPWRFQTA